jgi:hypothetical protein
MTDIRIAVAAAILALFAPCVVAQTPVSPAAVSKQDMAARNRDSVARHAGYEKDAIKIYFGDGNFLAVCAALEKPMPRAFTIYFEVLADGSLGKIVYEPLTQTAQCMMTNTASRTYPKPPGAAPYVSGIRMTFE